MIPGLRPLTTGQVLDRTFQIYRRNFALFAGISAVPQLSMLVLQLLLLGVTTYGVGGGMALALTTIVVGVAMIIVSLVVSAVATAATTFGVSDIYLDKPTSIGACFARVKGKIGKVAVTSIEFGLRVGLGLVLLIIPGVYFAGKWGLAIPAVVLEDINRKQAFPRSAALTADAIGRVIVVYFLTWILVMSVATALSFAIAAIAPGLTQAAGTVTAQVVQQLLSTVVSTLITPIMSIALTVLYYDQRVRKEAFDIDNLMALIGADSAKTAAASAN
jgi:hypothetical protein